MISTSDSRALGLAREGIFPYEKLGRPEHADVFVTAATDIRHMRTARDLAQRLTLLNDDGTLDLRPKIVVEFSLPRNVWIASPVFRNNPGFVGRGRTRGGAREFVIPNLPFSALRNPKVRIVE